MFNFNFLAGLMKQKIYMDEIDIITDHEKVDKYIISMKNI